MGSSGLDGVSVLRGSKEEVVADPEQRAEDVGSTYPDLVEVAAR